MKALRFVFCPEGGGVQVGNNTYAFPANYIVVTDVDATVNSDCAQCLYFDFHTGDLQSLYYNIVDLLDQVPQGLFYREPIQQVKADEDVIQVIQLLASANPAALLSFVYVYCLGLDRRYFSALLRHCVAGDQPFLDFIETNFLNPWSVSRFAEEFGLPLRKFNMLFQEKFGTSAKHWLLVRRLTHARELLLSTSMRVLDIALECGFGNHAHFTGSFRKHFHQSPSEIRRPYQDPCPEQQTVATTHPTIALEAHYEF